MRILFLSISASLWGCNTQPKTDSVYNNSGEHETEGTVPPLLSDTSEETDTAPSPPFTSSAESEKYQTYTYSQEETWGNPLKGFLSSYRWGVPANDFPHSLEFAYIPLSDLIQEEGIYRFDEGLEQLLIESANRGNHLIVRVYLDYPGLESGVPEFLLSSTNCYPYSEYGGGCSPDYSSPHLQSTLLDFIEAFGDRYDGDNRIGFIQLGLLGFWGEWHTYPHTQWFADALFQQDFIAGFDAAFDLTPIQIRIPAQDSPQRNIGFHDDSFAYSTIGNIDWFFWSKMVASGADNRWELHPMGGEVYPALQQTIFSDAYSIEEYSQDFQACVETTHASYMINYQAFNLNGSGYTELQRENAQVSSASMGYEYTMEMLSMTLSNINDRTVDLELDVRMRNSGVAPFYYPLALKLISGQQEEMVFQTNIQSILPTEAPLSFTLSVNGFPIDSLYPQLSIKLDSDILLTEQRIQFANLEQSNGLLPIDLDFFCTFSEERYNLADDRGDGCFCDVDGQFRTTESVVCDG